MSSITDAFRSSVEISPAATGKFSATDVEDATRWLGGYLAEAHADRDWLCSTSKDSPTEVFGPGLSEWLATKDGKRQLTGSLEPRLNGGKPCKWAAPGVVIGSQSVKPVLDPDYPDDLLDLEYKGQFGYRLTGASGFETLQAGDFRAVYKLTRKGSGWEIWAIGQNNYWGGLGWPDGLDIPDGYGANADRSPVKGATPTAWSEVSASLKATRKVAGADWQSVHTFATDSSGKKGQSSGAGTISPKGGFADLRFDGKDREIFFDGGRLDLSPADGALLARVGEAVPKKATWTSFDPTRSHAVFTSATDTNPFVQLALLDHVTSAAGAECTPEQAKSGGVKCYVARVAATNAAYSDGLATRLGWSLLASHQFVSDVHVAVNAKGQLVSTTRATSPPSQSVVPGSVTGTLRNLRDQAPAMPERPNDDAIAKEGTFYVAQ
ncbi:hypothetical protein [Knoellia sp. LjRoot47]|uniref:hypothetical protein n=1 Tax=Knoellia sp. LjRoot47 TaxID=3342330 RepID=UPI003ECCB098